MRAAWGIVFKQFYYGNSIGPSQRYLVNLVRPGREQPQQVTRVPRSAGGVATQSKYPTPFLFERYCLD